MHQAYSMEQVLDYKRMLEDREKENLARALKYKQQQKERLEQLLGVMEEQIDKAVDVYDIEHRGRFWDYQMQRISEVRQCLSQAELECDKVQLRLLAAAMERKKFEIHKDSELAEKRREQLSAEQKMLDETALVAFSRRKGKRYES